jgi:hypothetical protein
VAVGIKVQRDYLLTEVSVELPADVKQWDEIMRAAGTNGKMVVLYNQGSVLGINIEQRTKLPEQLATETRAKLKLVEKIL